MLKKLVVFLVIFAVLNGVLWAGGGKDNISLIADDPSGFTDTIDTSERKPGKYKALQYRLYGIQAVRSSKSLYKVNEVLLKPRISI